jgi:hypothetical protein
MGATQVPDLPEEDPDVRGGGQAHEDRHYRGDNEEQVRVRAWLRGFAAAVFATPLTLLQ